MFFMVAAYLKPGAEEQLINFSGDLSEHFEQSSLKIAGASSRSTANVCNG